MVGFLDKYTEATVKRSISPVVVSDNTAQVGQIIDHAGYVGVEYMVLTGTLADADATFDSKLEVSDASDMSGAVTLSTTDVIGTDPDFTYASDDQVLRIAYTGLKRYSRLTITPSANSGSAPIAACVRLTKKVY